MQQLRRAGGNAERTIVSNTSQLSIEFSSDIRLVTDVQPPFKIQYVNQNFEEAFDYPSAQVLNRDIASIYGADTKQFNCAIVKNIFPCSVLMTVYTSQREPRYCWQKIYPLYTNDGVVTSLLHVFEVSPAPGQWAELRRRFRPGGDARSPNERILVPAARLDEHEPEDRDERGLRTGCRCRIG
jgi:PAS domain-containing protein